MRILVIGCGYVGMRVARQWLAAGHQVSALTRSESNAHSLRSEGIDPILGNVLDVESLKQLPAADLCLYAVGYDRSALPDKRRVYVDGVRHVLSEVNNRVERVLYISSSSVFGQSQGEVVSESSTCEPTSEGGQICLEAEQVVRTLNPQTSCILRLSGIYGPQRLIARTEQLRQQTPLPGNPDAWLNLVHVDDIVAAISRLAKQREMSSLYLLSDAQPITRRDFYSTMAELIDAPPPVFQSSVDVSLGKRCDSSLIRTDLKLTLKYPTIYEGLPAAMNDIT